MLYVLNCCLQAPLTQHQTLPVVKQERRQKVPHRLPALPCGLHSLLQKCQQAPNLSRQTNLNASSLHAQSCCAGRDLCVGTDILTSCVKQDLHPVKIMMQTVPWSSSTRSQRCRKLVTMALGAEPCSRGKNQVDSTSDLYVHALPFHYQYCQFCLGSMQLVGARQRFTVVGNPTVLI